MEEDILLHNQLCSFKFPIVLCELCFVLHFTVLLFYWQCCLLILYIVFCCLHCDCLDLAAIKWFLTAFETLNLLTITAVQARMAACIVGCSSLT